MRVKEIKDETFQDYKKPAMFIATCFCDWKCCKELDLKESICQNSYIALNKTKEIENTEIINRYNNNNITKSIIFGGLEPILQIEEILDFIKEFREIGNQDDIVVYTGYYKNEIVDKIDRLKKYNNIIMKYGRYIPNSEKRYDNILGITLISNNQYAEKIS